MQIRLICSEFKKKSWRKIMNVEHACGYVKIRKYYYHIKSHETTNQHIIRASIFPDQLIHYPTYSQAKIRQSHTIKPNALSVTNSDPIPLKSK